MKHFVSALVIGALVLWGPAVSLAQGDPGGDSAEPGAADSAVQASDDGVPAAATEGAPVEPALPPPGESDESAASALGSDIPVQGDEVPEGGAVYSYLPGLLGMGIGGAAATGLTVGMLALNSEPFSSLGGWLMASLVLPGLVLGGTAAGVYLHGRAHGGQGSFWATLRGAFLGLVVSAVPFAAVVPTWNPGVWAVTAGLSVVVCIPLFASWAYWRNSNKHRGDVAEASGSVIPTFGFSENGVHLGAAGTF